MTAIPSLGTMAAPSHPGQLLQDLQQLPPSAIRPNQSGAAKRIYPIADGDDNVEVVVGDFAPNLATAFILNYRGILESSFSCNSWEDRVSFWEGHISSWEGHVSFFERLHKQKDRRWSTFDNLAKLTSAPHFSPGSCHLVTVSVSRMDTTSFLNF